ncbi:dihydroxyacetone kinase subunit DhaK [Paraburkholderia humisilvae]|uniref:PTS-dependent dihydroxyacetone kinase 2, dihydroxyacetone-binding subunit DhaK n=1 Tax=Paraburkholderia humisilvae TaxID=627669 RepID=A0A6J5F764_9BURK|nr:dihydroxyacetone kinase subunit DhaK [Paraburkholderia humisilvae]CAB3773155.1 PTS-dependent dihydroxyacetone kinase 2, dihydroxyacetone-binding subunit DhaK [Paraburkholderia humisilvae]
MKKIINQPDQFVDEIIESLFVAHPGWIKPVTADHRALVRADAPRAGQVGIVTGGGSGHLPGFLGYVGQGLCSGVAVGNVFSSPSAEQIFEATKAVNGGPGVLYVYGNYGGDVLNFDLAADLAEAEGIDVKTVVLTDDVASAPPERASDRRGVAGMVFAFKCAGAAAERGDSLAEVARITAQANGACRTMGVGLSPTILPAAGKPTFMLPEGQMEIGIGIHGEPGTHRGALESADAIADRLTGAILRDLAAPKGARVAVLINGLGATPLEELYLLYRRTAKVIGDHGLTIARSYVGEYVTSLEMAGASITVMQLDAELEALLAAPARSPFFRDWRLA